MRIYFSPSFPKTQDYSIIAMIHYLGYSVTRTSEEPFDFGYMWNDSTYVTPSEELRKIAKEKVVLNINCTDISKVYVDHIFKEISGYGSLIDPFTYQGKCIKKYDENGKGGGEIIACPIKNHSSSEGSIYQKFIETNPSGPQLEYRVPIVMGVPPIVFEVYKDNPETVEGKLIKNQMKHSITIKNTDTIFSKKEQEQIIQFCRNIGFDIGELDILRCAETKKMYIIDANTTPTYFNMLNRYWNPLEKRKAIAIVAEEWEKQLKTLLPNLQTT